MKNRISVLIRNKNNVYEGNNRVDKFTSIISSYLGYTSYVGSNCRILYTKIGRFCSIASGVRVVTGSHPTREFVSTSPVFYSLRPPCGKSLTKEQLYTEYHYFDGENAGYMVLVGNDVWVGYNVMLMQGIRIGDGAVLAAGSVVTKDVEPYSIVGGNPANHIRYRFSTEEIDFLKKLQWWNKEQRWIEAHANYFSSIRELMRICSNEDDGNE